MANQAAKTAESARMVAEAYEQHGLDRVRLAGRLGLSTGTIRHVEKGRQPLGAPSFRRMRQLLNELARAPTQAVHEAPPGCPAAPSIDTVVDLLMDEGVRAAAEVVASALECSLREAMEIVVRKRLETRRKRS